MFTVCPRGPPRVLQGVALLDVIRECLHVAGRRISSQEVEFRFHQSETEIKHQTTF